MTFFSVFEPWPVCAGAEIEKRRSISKTSFLRKYESLEKYTEIRISIGAKNSINPFTGPLFPKTDQECLQSFLLESIVWKKDLGISNMSKGYHSRSPEEFQDFLRKSRDAGKSKNRSKLILFFDVILLLFIFSVVAKLLNPLAFSGQTESKEISSGFVSYRLSSSKENSKEFPIFFLFLKNKGTERLSFPNEGTRIRVFIKSGDLNCLEDSWTLASKTLEPGSTNFFRYEISSERFSALPPECRTHEKSMWNNISGAFQGVKKRSFHAEILRKNENISLEIPNF